MWLCSLGFARDHPPSACSSPGVCFFQSTNLIMKFSSLALLTSSAVATLCSNTSYPYAGKTISVPLVPVTTAQAGPVNGTLINPPTISGTIEITSGCGFTVKNFTFTPVGTSVYSFYGIQKANASVCNYSNLSSLIDL